MKQGNFTKCARDDVADGNLGSRAPAQDFCPVRRVGNGDPRPLRWCYNLNCNYETFLPDSLHLSFLAFDSWSRLPRDRKWDHPRFIRSLAPPIGGGPEIGLTATTGVAVKGRLLTPSGEPDAGVDFGVFDSDGDGQGGQASDWVKPRAIRSQARFAGSNVRLSRNC